MNNFFLPFVTFFFFSLTAIGIDFDFKDPKGVNNIILGCTELPLIINNSNIDINANFIDPVDILSEYMIFDYYYDEL